MPKPLRAAIKGLGAAVPKKIMTNADFEKFLDTSDEWITTRTGIKQRRFVSEGESTGTLGAEAAKKAIADAGISPRDLDLIICATVSPDVMFPATACLIQKAIGAPGIGAFDISAACSGWLYALNVASQFIETGKYRRILVVGSETLSRFCDFTDRSSCILFGDAAGAAVLEATEEKNKGIIYNVMHADGDGWDFIHVPGGGSLEPPSEQTIKDRRHFVKMRGKDVYRFAVEKLQWLIGDCMEQCNLDVGDVDMVIPHQVNMRIIKSAIAKYNFPLEKVYVNIERYGNTSAASIPLAMTEAYEAGKIKPGDTILLVAFGAGLTWAGTVIRM